ncbi:alpha amylase C-terminal domain-containing protein [Pontiella sulfatireligans]|uniref:1,4-alpha-glucan branching enzyme n=1 Tax=Pontiella sulfatireligans TaxID=2750658 RepID=A0A6C2UIX5_9BACT|nr:alpha amylase C-terminal domain-containing protein [Pontiella sulfatireligans]VGO19833.1 1,4-alpha-glucan branching enzyme GlgB [Pontiella sulfatireligans]
MRDPKLAKLSDDPWLEPFLGQIHQRTEHIKYVEDRLTGGKISLNEFANAHEYYGLHFRDGKWIFREWAPNATAIYMVGDFSNWKQEDEFALHYGDGNGVWEIEIPAEKLKHGSLYKLKMYWPGGEGERLPAYVRRTVQDPETHIFTAQVWHPETAYDWKHPDPVKPVGAPIVYESHIGMAQEDAKVGSYLEYKEKILPRIVEMGYNTVQFMGIMEHPYYGSFGYHVSNFFAASSRFGTPEELKELIDACHEAGLAVIMDLVHSHSVKNEEEGLSRFDGTSYQYFHEGARGDHDAWDSRCFDYSKPEVLHFLLSNSRYWLDEFKFDGYRFDGVTSMLYHHHGLGTAFTDYSCYFDGAVDNDALAYLALANKLIHEVRPAAITIAEDVSGMPGLAAPGSEGGCGFDYRLAMGVPDLWFKLANDTPDEEWSMNGLYHELTNHRAEEQVISYVESHDQALVGGKTFIFELIDKEMYYSMHVDSQNLIVARGIALHKMARLATLGASAHGYLNFMGNEFGHPEWIDFPREGNNWSYQYARRQWNLRDDPTLKFHSLAEFDQAMVNLIRGKGVIGHDPVVFRLINEGDKVMAFERDGLVFVLNFHPNKSFSDYPVDVTPGKYRLALNTDSPAFGGYDIVQGEQTYESFSFHDGEHDRNQINLYIPARTGFVLERI